MILNYFLIWFSIVGLSVQWYSHNQLTITPLDPPRTHSFPFTIPCDTSKSSSIPTSKSSTTPCTTLSKSSTSLPPPTSSTPCSLSTTSLPPPTSSTPCTSPTSSSTSSTPCSSSTTSPPTSSTCVPISVTVFKTVYVTQYQTVTLPGSLSIITTTLAPSFTCAAGTTYVTNYNYGNFTTTLGCCSNTARSSKSHLCPSFCPYTASTSCAPITTTVPVVVTKDCTSTSCPSPKSCSLTVLSSCDITKPTTIIVTKDCQSSSTSSSEGCSFPPVTSSTTCLGVIRTVYINTCSDSSSTLSATPTATCTPITVSASCTNTNSNSVSTTTDSQSTSCSAATVTVRPPCTTTITNPPVVTTCPPIKCDREHDYLVLFILFLVLFVIFFFLFCAACLWHWRLRRRCRCVTCSLLAYECICPTGPVFGAATAGAVAGAGAGAGAGSGPTDHAGDSGDYSGGGTYIRRPDGD